MENTTTNVVNSHADVPDISNYVTPLNQNDFSLFQGKIEPVLQTFQNKIDQNSALIIANENEIFLKEDQFSKLKRVDNYDNELTGKDIHYNFILDCISFVHRDPQLKVINKELLKSLFNIINNKGVLVLLMDYQHLLQVTTVLSEILNENEKVNILIKMHIINKVPLVGLISLQRFDGSTCKIENLKILSYEIYEDNTITKPVTYLVNDIGKSLNYMYEIYQYQGYLSELRPGTILKINVKETFWSDNIDFTLTVVDSEDEQVIAQKKCASIIVTKAYSNDFIYLTKEGNMQLCKQVNSSRIILIRPNAFNFDSAQVIKEKISHYILLFKFKDCVDESIPIMQFSDSKNEQYEVYRNEKFVIRDMVENDKKETFRQLIFSDSPNEVQSEIKLILTTKAKAKTDTDYYTTLPTINKYKDKHLVSCLDKNFICSFYIKCLLCGIFFIKTEEFPKSNLNIMVLGAGIGSVNHFFNKIFKNRINITSVEIDNVMPEIGRKYFGFDNSLKTYKWIYDDANNYLVKSKGETKFDIIISDINNTNSKEGLSPPPVFFSNDTLFSIKESLKDTGLYIINLMARSYNNYNNALTALEFHFENIFVVENNEDLNKIHFCFKKKIENEEYVKIFKYNLENFQENADISVIENDYKRILNKIVDRNDIVKKKIY